MKITIVQGAFLPVPPLMGGAVEKIWFSLGSEFAKRGHQVTHISRLCCNLPQNEMINGVQHLRIPGFNSPRSILFLKLLDLIYSYHVLKLLPRADILITNTFWLPLLICDQNYGAIYVHAVRYPKGQMALYSHAARIQTVSNAVAKAIEKQSPKLKPIIRVIPNPLPDNPDLYLGSATYKREKWFLYTGRLHPEKGIDLLLKAYDSLISSNYTSWKLILIGPWESKLGGGGRKYYDALRKNTFLMKDHITFVGFLSDPKYLMEYYLKASLFVYPSIAEKGESFGLAPLEAMSYGCPTLVSNLDCFKDFIEDDKTGFVFNHRSPDPALTLAEKMKELIENSDKLKEVSINAFEKSREYTVEKIADQYLADFESLLKK